MYFYICVLVNLIYFIAFPHPQFYRKKVCLFQYFPISLHPKSNDSKAIVEYKHFIKKKMKRIIDLITGRAIYPVSTDELKALLGDSHSTLRLTSEPGVAVEEFMRRAFSNALSIEHVAQSTWQCNLH